MKRWNKACLTISAVQCKYHETSEEIFDNYVKQSNFNTEQLLHLTANGHMAFYNEERDGKKLDEYLKRSKKAGIKEIIYDNIHCVTAEDQIMKNIRNIHFLIKTVMRSRYMVHNL